MQPLPQRRFSPGFRVEPLSDREGFELASRAQRPDEYVAVEVAPAEFNLGVELDGCVIAVMLIRLPPGSLLDLKPNRVLGGPPTDNLGLGNSSNPLRLVVRKDAVTKPAREAYPQHFQPPTPAEPADTFEVLDPTEAVPVMGPTGGLLGAILGKLPPTED